ncbi:MAG: FAD-dependent oxidoreductase [Candidatus Binatia bacterium]
MDGEQPSSGGPKTLVIGGGLAGVATAYTLARAGWQNVTIVEQSDALGGLAASFEQDGRFYPLGYHHILHRDRTLLFFLDRIGAIGRVRWRRVQMLFRQHERIHALGTISGFLRYPLPLLDKARFIRLMLRAFRKQDWSDWLDAPAADLIDSWASPAVRRAIFEPLARLRFEASCEDLSAAWLGARLHYREGSAPLGYIPGANWTKVLCDGVSRLVEEAGVRVKLGARVSALRVRDAKMSAVETAAGETMAGDLFVNNLPTETYRMLCPGDRTPALDAIRYSALLSFICGTRQTLSREFYWLNLSPGETTACAIFQLSALNPHISAPGETCLNFVTHLRSRERPLFRLPEDELHGRYSADFLRVFGSPLEPVWTHLTRVGLYAPIFDRGYRNLPVQSSTFANVYFAGNYRTHPSIVSTGTALGSGIETGEAILRAHGQRSDLAELARSYRLRAMPVESSAETRRHP